MNWNSHQCRFQNCNASDACAASKRVLKASEESSESPSTCFLIVNRLAIDKKNVGLCTTNDSWHELNTHCRIQSTRWFFNITSFLIDATSTASYSWHHVDVRDCLSSWDMLRLRLVRPDWTYIDFEFRASASKSGCSFNRLAISAMIELTAVNVAESIMIWPPWGTVLIIFASFTACKLVILL